MLFRRGSRLEAPLVLDAAGATIGAVERRGFARLPLDRQERMRRNHADNQDSHIITPNLLAVGDGVTTEDAGKATSQRAVEEMSSFVEDAGIAEQSPRKAKRTMDEAAAHTDDVLRGLELGGSTTLDMLARTADPNIWVGRHVGDSNRQQNRGGLVIGRTVPQSVDFFDPRLNQVVPAVSNTLAGRGRVGFWQAVQIAGKFGVQRSLFMDQAELLRVMPGDEFLLYTDGNEVYRGGGTQIVTPEVMAAESARYDTAAEAAGALITFPERLADQTPEPGTLVKNDDFTVIVGRLAVA
jgi:serine/threonine protein phosphatase PrpC